jgi:hypothetical protein
MDLTSYGGRQLLVPLPPGGRHVTARLIRHGAFYCQVLGMRINEDIDAWAVIGLEPAFGSWPFSG